jgi:predicted metal-binding protein
MYMVIEGDGKMKVGLIRCLQTEDMCGTTLCLKAIKAHMGAFQDSQEEIELMNINTCGGCPGKKAITRAENMVKNGCDTIVLSSCITHLLLDFPVLTKIGCFLFCAKDFVTIFEF